jgi:hypothetical protein
MLGSSISLSPPSVGLEHKAGVFPQLADVGEGVTQRRKK